MIFRSLAEIPPGYGPSAITIGNFDGVHAGHRAIAHQVSAEAHSHGWRAVVLTFHPHPTKLLTTHKASQLLSTPEQRAVLMSAEGIDDVLILPFTLDLAKLTPEEFVQHALIEKLHARAVFVGEDFRFGHKAAGDIHTLRELGARFGFQTHVLSHVERRGRVVSSTAVRGLLAAGNVSLAARLLERPYSLEGPVVPGHGVGSRQTVPTLNLSTPVEEVIPARGVYITRTHDAATGRHWQSITNVGYRPTFDGDALTIETFLLSPFDGHTPARIRVEFLRRVRDERKFDTPAALRAQILRDVARARAYFRRLQALPSLRRPAYTGRET